MKNIFISTQIVLGTFLAFLFFVPKNSDAFLEGVSQSMGALNEQMTKFVEGLHESVDVWASKVIDNANKEECLFVCPRGEQPIKKQDVNISNTAKCQTFGITINDEDLPSKRMRSCCSKQYHCYHICEANKTSCDLEFQDCLHKECQVITKNDPKQMHICDTATKLLLMGILSFGCKTFKDSQRDVCNCPAPKEL